MDRKSTVGNSDFFQTAETADDTDDTDNNTRRFFNILNLDLAWLSNLGACNMRMLTFCKNYFKLDQIGFPNTIFNYLVKVFVSK